MKVTEQRGDVPVLLRGEDQTSGGVHHRQQSVDMITGQIVQRGIAVVQSRQNQRGDQRLQDCWRHNDRRILRNWRKTAKQLDTVLET